MQDRTIHTTISGVHFQLGEAHQNYLQPETIEIDGTLSKSWNGLATFRGIIAFEEDTSPVPEAFRRTTIKFDKAGFGPLVYGYIEHAGTADATPRTYSNGILFINSDFTTMVLLPREGWNGEDGKMFAGPASTREEALRIANERMKLFLQEVEAGNGSYLLK